MNYEIDKKGLTRIVIVLLVITLIVRVIFAFYFNRIEIWHSFAEDNARLSFARSILNEGFVHDTNNFINPESIFAPLIPIVLALNMLIFGDSLLSVFILNAFLGTITCMLIYLIALRFFEQKVAVFSLLWAAFYPSYIRYIGTCGNEPWIVFLFALTFLFTIRSIDSDKINLNLVFFSLSLTLLFHTDERYLTYPLLFATFLLIGNSDLNLKIRKIVFFVLFTAFFSMPWVIRNYLYYDDIVLISSRTNSLTDVFFKHREELMFFDHTPDNAFLSREKIDSIHNGFAVRFPDGKSISPGQIATIRAGNIPHSFTMREKTFSRLYFLWLPFKFKDNYRIEGYSFNPAWSLKHNMVSILTYGILLPFVLISFIILARQNRLFEIFLFSGIIVFHTLIHVAFIPYTRDRYRNPIDFIIIILGCFGIVLIFKYIKDRIGNRANKNE